MDFNKINNNTYALFRKHKVLLPLPITQSWFAPFPGYDNQIPNESSIQLTPIEYSNIIDNVNLIIKTNDIKKRKIIAYLIISLIIGACTPVLVFAPFFVLMGVGIIIYLSIFFLIAKLILSINIMKDEVNQKVKEFNLKHENIAVKLTFKAKRNTTRHYPYKLRLYYPLSSEQLDLIKQFNIQNPQQQQQQQRQQTNLFEQAPPSPQQQPPKPQQQIIDVGYDNDFGDFGDNYSSTSTLLQK